MKTPSSVALVVAALLVTASCRQDMQDQPKYKPLGQNRFFADGRDSRPTPAGTIARDELNDDDVLHTGNANGTFAETIPVPINSTVLHRGQDRYNIYCTPCHGPLGDGDGMIHRRGFWRPANLHTDRLRSVPPGYLYQVIANGYGAMPEYKDQIPVTDRWAIVAYLRALQLSRHANVSELSPEMRQQLDRPGSSQPGSHQQ